MKHTKKLRILMLSFVYFPNLGGVETHLLDLTKYLLKHGHSVTVLTYKTLGMKERNSFVKKVNNLTIIRIPWFHPRIFNAFENYPILQILYLVPIMFLFTLFYVAFRIRNFDIIQVHGFNMAIVGAITSFIYRIPVIINTHVSFYFQQSSVYAKILGFFLKRAKNILVLTVEAGRELEKIGIEKNKIVLYHYWIDGKKFFPHDRVISRNNLGISQNIFVVLFVGRFSPAKGITILMEAASHFPKNVEVLFCGAGPLESYIADNARSSRAVKLVGSVDQQDLPTYYSAADIVIIPSTPVTEIYSEGIPRVLIESYSCGTPVVVTPTGGTCDSITPKIGFTIKPTSQSIVGIIKLLVENKQKLRKMRQECIEYSNNNFSEEVNGRIIEESLQ